MGGGAGLTLGRLAEVLKATLDGQPDRLVTRVAPLATAGADDLAYVSDRRQLAAARASRAGAFLAAEDVDGLPAPTLRCGDPRRAFVTALTLLHPAAPDAPGIDPSAHVAGDARVDPTASVGALAIIGPGASIGARARIGPLVCLGANVEVGEGSVLFPQVVVYDGCRLGRRVIVHAGVVIGADGFGFVPDAAGHLKIPQVGIVVIEDDVEIGANSAIDRATLGHTVIGRGTKLDNLVQIGHNVEVGAGSLMAAQVGIGGSSRIGRGVMLGGQVGIADHVDVGDGAMLAAQSGAIHDVPAGERFALTWARPAKQAERIWVSTGQLPDLLRRFRTLEKRVAELEARLAARGEADAG